MQASDSIRGEGFTVLRFQALYPPGCSYGGAIDANAMVRVPVFVAFWSCFVLRMRSPSGPARRFGPLRWARDALLRVGQSWAGKTAEKARRAGARLARFEAVATAGEAFS